MKPTDEQVERVTAAIRASDAYWWNRSDEPDDGLAETLARAAIAAMPALPAQGEPVAWDDDKLAAWARNWHWNDCAADQPVDPSIYFRDKRMLRAFLAALPNSPAISPADLAEVLENARKAIENLSDFRSVKSVPIELHKACHALTHIVALLKP